MFMDGCWDLAYDHVGGVVAAIGAWPLMLARRAC